MEQKERELNARNEFVTTILGILSQDATQSCNNSEGTKVTLMPENITINDEISMATLSKLMKTRYLVMCDKNGCVSITNVCINKGE